MATRGLPHWPWQGADTASLPPAESILLEATRRWAGAEGMSPPLATADALAANGPIDAMLRAVVAGRDLRLGTLPAPRVMPDEALLLMGCALTQTASRPEALATWCALLPPRPAYAAMGHALHLAAAFRQAGLVFAKPLQQLACGALHFPGH